MLEIPQNRGVEASSTIPRALRRQAQRSDGQVVQEETHQGRNQRAPTGPPPERGLKGKELLSSLGANSACAMRVAHGSLRV
jgi:hypothetical protein